MKSNKLVIFSIIAAAVFISLLVMIAGPDRSEELPQTSESQAEPERQEERPIQTKECFVPSQERAGVQIPVYLTFPADDSQGKPIPLVLMLHGYGSNHNESGGFDPIAESLAKQGCMVAMLDFPGCGNSTESFEDNTMTHMKSDVQDVLTELCIQYPIDSDRIGALGYSLGGRILLELIAENRLPLTAMELVAPAEDVRDFQRMFGGTEQWGQLRQEAYENGVSYYSGQGLRKEWFQDLEAYSHLAEQAAKQYTHSSLVVWSQDDTVVNPKVSQNTAEALGSDTLVLHENGHGYSFHGGNLGVIAQVNHESMNYFIEALRLFQP